MNEPFDVRVAAEMKEIFAELPDRLRINEIIQNAYERLHNVALAYRDEGQPPTNAETQMIHDKLVEILSEIATYAVDQFTGRTGQPFAWIDEPEFEPNEENTLMHFSIDEKGNLVF